VIVRRLVALVGRLLAHRWVDMMLAFVFALAAPPILEGTAPGQALDDALRSFLHAFACLHVGF
jgi:hypothetical protein